MQATEKPEAFKNKFSGTIFALGLLSIAIAGTSFILFGWKFSGILFCVGMFACLGSTVVSVIFGEKATPGEVVTMAAGAAFFAWLILHNL